MRGGEGHFTFAYDADMTIEQKIDAIVRRIYGGDGASIAPAAKKQMARLTELGFGNMPVHGQNAVQLFRRPKKLGAPAGFTVTVRSVKVSAGAGFIVALTGHNDHARPAQVPRRRAHRRGRKGRHQRTILKGRQTPGTYNRTNNAHKLI
ncbi:MAG: formate--tetrahydrofolate ligase [Oscillospiraceae bacterium]